MASPSTRVAVALSGVLWRAAAWLLRPQPEPTTVELPAIDSDGDRCWVTSTHYPTPSERAWSEHPDETMRAAYHVHAVTLARAQAERDGYAMGWSE